MKDLNKLQNELDKLRVENDEMQTILSYLGKIPTQPYEKELAKSNLELRAVIEDLIQAILDPSNGRSEEAVNNARSKVEGLK